MTDPRIVFDNVSRFYGEVLGVNRVNLSIPPGITSLVGPNGSGKTTLMNLMAGLIRPSRGTIDVLGIPPGRPEELFRKMGYCTQFDAFPKGLTGYQFIYSFLLVHGMIESEAAKLTEEALQRVSMTEAADRLVAAYSKGMRQRIKLAQAIAHRPTVLVLDEPLNGLDPMARNETIALFKQWGEEGRHVIVSSHILQEGQHFDCPRTSFLAASQRLLPSPELRLIHTVPLQLQHSACTPPRINYQIYTFLPGESRQPTADWGFQHGKARRHLSTLLSSKYTGREEAAEWLSRRGGSRAIDALVECLTYADLETRKLAALGLGRLRAKSAVERLRNVALTDRNYYAGPQVAAVSALAQIGDLNGLIKCLDLEVAQHRPWPLASCQWVARREAHRRQRDLSSPVEHQQQAAAHHVTRRAVGLIPSPRRAQFAGEPSPAGSRMGRNQLADTLRPRYRQSAGIESSVPEKNLERKAPDQLFAGFFNSLAATSALPPPQGCRLPAVTAPGAPPALALHYSPRATK